MNIIQSSHVERTSGQKILIAMMGNAKGMAVQDERGCVEMSPLLFTPSSLYPTLPIHVKMTQG